MCIRDSPNSDQAQAVADALVMECERLSIRIRCNTTCQEIIPHKYGFRVRTCLLYTSRCVYETAFAQLLTEIEKIEGLERIRFMTSHPKDLSDELIEVMGCSKKICKHLHLPVQSGSTRILEKMNRRYTKEQYLDLVERIRRAVPDISLTTDIIVGFPGETEEDFLETMDVVKKVRYDSAFTFQYSKRTGTPAAVMEDQIPADVVTDRFNRLLKEVQQISAETCSVYTVSYTHLDVYKRQYPDRIRMRCI